MKTNVKKSRRILLMLGLVMMLAVVLVACVNTDKVPEVDKEFESRDTNIGEVDTSEDRDLEPEEGQSNAPVVTDIVHISPLKVAVSGTCDEGALIRVKCGGNVVEVNSRDGYFIAEVELVNEGGNLVSVTAQVSDKTESKPWEEAVYKNATADTRLDGMSVSVGPDSRLYFDFMKANYMGGTDTIYTVSELNKIRDTVNKDVANYNKHAGVQESQIIYLLLPDAASIYPEVLPADTVPSATGTIYDQMLDALGQTRATVIDMREKFKTLKDDPAVIEKGGLYRVTDSSLTDYGAYLVYQELMNEYIAKKFPAAMARPVTDFEWEFVENAAGGNLVGYRELDQSVITESFWKSTPKFSLDLGTDSKSTDNLSSIVKYVDAKNKDFNFNVEVDANDGIKTIAERAVIDTGRADAGLPTAIICRDYNSYAFTDILVERFEKTLLLRGGEFYLDTNDSATLGDNAAAGDTAPDYIIYILSEQSMKTAFGNALAG